MNFGCGFSVREWSLFIKYLVLINLVLCIFNKVLCLIFEVCVVGGFEFFYRFIYEGVWILVCLLVMIRKLNDCIVLKE